MYARKIPNSVGILDGPFGWGFAINNPRRGPVLERRQPYPPVDLYPNITLAMRRVRHGSSHDTSVHTISMVFRIFQITLKQVDVSKLALGPLLLNDCDTRPQYKRNVTRGHVRHPTRGA